MHLSRDYDSLVVVIANLRRGLSPPADAKVVAPIVVAVLFFEASRAGVSVVSVVVVGCFPRLDGDPSAVVPLSDMRRLLQFQVGEPVGGGHRLFSQMHDFAAPRTAIP